MFFKFDERIYCYILYRFSFFWLFLFPGIFCSQVQAEFRVLLDQSGKNTVRTRFQPPEDYVWQKEIPGSFGDFLEQLPLLPDGAPVRDFRGNPVGKQHLHAAVIRLDTGDRDLQQCADAWIRLYAEYLWQNKHFDDIAFRFTSGQKMSWNDFRKGMRTIERGDSVTFVHRGSVDGSYGSFRKYLDLVFQYAGSISLDRESVPVTSDREIKVGDFLIAPGSPGHVVMIVGAARNSSGHNLYLLAESFMPAQDIHILKNPGNLKISPWYEIHVKAPQMATTRYIFRPPSVKRFYELYQHR